MSDVTPQDIREEVALLPTQIITHPRFNVRPFSSESEMEDNEVELLAQSMERVGQLDAIIITPDKILIAGHRRRRAVLIINERRSVRGQSLIRLRCAIDRSGGDLRQKAIISNLQRRETSPMDLAYLITQIRKEHHWDGATGTNQVADYLQVNRATIVQHEKLLCCEKELQNRIHCRTISAQSAFDLLKGLATPQERIQAIERATEIQSEDRLHKALDDHKAGKKTEKETIETINMAPKVRIEHPAIVKAIRERHTTTIAVKHLSLTRSELVASLSQFDTETCPEALRDFVHYWVYSYAQGLGNPEELRTKFLAITQAPEPKSKPVHQAQTLVS